MGIIKMINKRRSFITGIKGTKLSQKEAAFLKKYKPWGVILFSRNIKLQFTFEQHYQIKTSQKTKNLRLSFDYTFGATEDIRRAYLIQQ